jgi:biotin operon repressor
MTQHEVLQLLQKHIGRSNGVSADEIGRALDLEPRQVRKLISQLRAEGIAVCAHPTTGYYIADDPDDVLRTCEFLRKRAMHSLEIQSKLLKISLPDLIGQRHLRT